MAPPWRHHRSLEKAAKTRGKPFLGFGRRARGLRGRPTCRLTFNSPPLTLYSPALRVSAGKSGVGGGECQVSWMQISVSFMCQAIHGVFPYYCTLRKDTRHVVDVAFNASSHSYLPSVFVEIVIATPPLSSVCPTSSCRARQPNPPRGTELMNLFDVHYCTEPRTRHL